MNGKILFLASLLILRTSIHADAADLVEVSVLTNEIIVLHFDEGFIEYNSYKEEEQATKVNRWPLLVDWAKKSQSYMVISTNDSNYQLGLQPKVVYRKSKPQQISNICNWVNSICDNEVVYEHFIYLKLSQPLQSGKSYTIKFTQPNSDEEQHELLYNPNQIRSHLIHLNQIGFLPEARKKYAYLSHWMGDGGGLNIDNFEGSTFHLVDLASGEKVFTGTINKRLDIEDGGYIDLPQSPEQGFISMSDVWECDFSSFTQTGEYRLVVEDMGCSFSFKIEPDIYREAFYHTTRQLYHQRTGIELKPEFTEWTRPRTLHPDDGRIKFKYTSSVWTGWTGNERENGNQEEVLSKVQADIDIQTWGWYMDAGDWDGYYHHSKVPRYLMTAFELAPEKFIDGELNIPESGNGMPDLLDEAQWLLNYLHRTRGPTGGVAGGRIHPDFEQKDNKFIPSWDDTRTWLISGEDPVTTYTFAGMAAQFAHCLGLANHKDSAQWAERAIEAYAWAEANESIAKGDLLGGRLYANALLYKLTGIKTYENQYIADRSLQKNRFEAHENQQFADWAYLNTQHTNKNLNFWNTLLKEYQQNVNANLIETANNRSFRAAWSPNFKTFLGQATTPQVFPALVLYYVTKDPALLDAAITSVDYVMGGNPLDMTWVVGMGDKHPRELLHLDTWYHPEDRSDFYISGSIPYGPVAYGLSWHPNQGPWSSDFAWVKVYPEQSQWPLHEGYFDNKLSVPTNEYTIHQTSAPAAAVFALLSGDPDSNFKPNQRPEVVLEVPDETSLGEEVLLKADASDEDGYIAKVVFYANGRKIGEAVEAPFELSWKVNTAAVSISAIATDNEGLTSRIKKK